MCYIAGTQGAVATWHIATQAATWLLVFLKKIKIKIMSRLGLIRLNSKARSEQKQVRTILTRVESDPRVLLVAGSVRLFDISGRASCRSICTVMLQFNKNQ